MKALVLPVAAGVFFLIAVMLSPLFTGRRWWVALVYLFAAAGVLAVMGLTRPLAGSHVAALRLVDDALARIAFIVAVAVAGFTGLVVADYRRANPHASGEATALVLASVTGALIAAMAGDFLLLIVGIELASLPVYVLTGILRNRPRPAEGAMKYILLGGFATGVMVYGSALIYAAAGSTSMIAAVNALHTGASKHILIAGLALFATGLAFKASLAPFHMWTPDVYEGAPTPYTAFMSAVIKFVAFAGIIRLFAFFAFVTELKHIIIALAVISMVWGNFAALVQDNVKRMLAYSSVAHAGYILVPLATGHKEGVVAALFYLVLYALMSAGAFGLISYNEGEEGKGVTFEDLTALGVKKPLIGLCGVILFFALAGVPPTGGFMAKFYAFKAAVDGGLWWLALVGIFTSMVGAYYYLKVIVFMYMKKREGTGSTGNAKVLTVAGVLLLSLFVLAYGVDPKSLLDVVKVAAEGALQLLY